MAKSLILYYRQDHNNKTNAKGSRIFGDLAQLTSKDTMQKPVD